MRNLIDKIILSALFFILAVFFIPQSAQALQQSENVCYSQCIAYKFVWHGTYCYDLFADNCGQDSGNTIIKTIKLLKGVYDTLKSGDNVDTAFKAWFVCKPLIESCIVPHQQNCHATCSLDQYVYAPDLSVGHPESSFHGAYYDQNSKQLFFKLVNNGMGYAWDIDVEASYSHTPNRDGQFASGTQLFKEKVEHLIYLGARNGPPKSFSDTVGDFLIEESLNGQYLHNFKSWLVDSLDLHSDSKNYNVPNYWIKAIPFDPKPGELNRIIFNVDGNKLIPESNENNNTFILDIDLRPTPARFSVETLTQHIVDGALNSFLINFQVKNTGEEGGLAQAKIYNGKYEQGKTPIYESEQNIAGKNNATFETTVDIDTKNEAGAYCGKYKEYTLVIVDADGNRTERNFSLPIYVGSVNGRVEDLFGKKVVGAAVKASTGEETVTNNMGYFHLKGITRLGRITVTASHQEFSKSDSRELEFKYVNEFEACDENNLNFNSVNFVLKDQDVLFTVTVRDQSGNPVNAHVLAVNSSFRKEADIDGSGPMPELQPGKYTFIITAAGYKTLSQDVNAVPNDMNLEFVLEKLNGRPDDNGLHLVSPKLLWKKTLGQGEKIISNMSDSQNGNLLVAYVLDNKAKNSNLYFLDLLTGRQIKEDSAPYALGYEGFVKLDASYDGGTVGLNTDLGIKKDNERIMKIFNASGGEIGSITLSKGKGGQATSMDVSPDGFYLCTFQLLDKGLHRYTRYETEGKGDDDYKRNPASCGDHFLRNNNYLDSCKDGLCEKTISNQQVRVIGKLEEGINVKSTLFDSVFNDKTIVVRTFKKLYYFGASSWNRELKSDNIYKSVAVSPGGMYTIVAAGSSSNMALKIFGNTGGDKTPDFPYKNVKFVFANDKGLFFAQVVLNRIEFYQIGKYQNEYKPEETTEQVGADTTNDLSRLSGSSFVPAGVVSFSTITPGLIYRAEKNIRLKYLNPAGFLDITEGTIFSKEYNHKPVLLKGQLTASFSSPMTIYAIKFDRYELPLFQSKLSQFIAGTLSEDEYFIVKNIHTKFIVRNEVNNFNVAVDSGDVQIISKKISETVSQNRQITISGKNNVKKSLYINAAIYQIIGLVFLAAAGIFLYIKRNTPAGKKH